MQPSGIPPTMMAIEISRPGGPDVLRSASRAVPTVGAGEVLLEVHAAGLNRLDVNQRQGRTKPPPGASDIPGVEAAGRIVALGEGVSGWSVGDRCMAIHTGGGYAEYMAVPAEQCLPVPPGLTLVEAAGIPETFLTVWSTVFMMAHLQPGEWLLTHGGASGIGTSAIQLARHLGMRCIVTAGADERCEACIRLGADRAVNYRASDFVAAALEATGGRGVDVVLDFIAGDYLPRNLAAMAFGGRLVMIATMRGSTTTTDVLRIMTHRLTIMGAAFRSRSKAEKSAIVADFRERALPLVADGRVRPVVDAVFPFEQIAEAHRRLEAGPLGKVLLQLRQEG